MIRLFGTTDKTYQSNGDLVIRALKAKVHKEDNGSFYFDLETGLEYVEELTEGRILVVNTPQGDQAFRVSNVKQTKHKLTTRARHVFYDSMNYLIRDSYVVDKDGNDALDHLNGATEPSSPFTTISDVTTINSFRCVRQSLYEALQTVVERWGGHLVMDNWQIGLRASIGQDNQVNVTYGKNLQDITAQYDWDDVVTKLLPTGYDGIMLDEVYLTSDIQYDVPYTKTVEFYQNLDQDEYRDESGNLDEEAWTAALKADLRQQATAYLQENCVPRVNYSLKANLEKITDVGDTVYVRDQRLGISLLTNVIAYDYDPILDKYTGLQFGNFRRTITGFANAVTAQTRQIAEEAAEPVKVTLRSELEQATAQIWQTLGNSYVIYDGDKILVLDTLPKESATNVIMINSAGIGFSSTGINGTFNSAWTIDGTMDMQNINVINLVADMIKGGTLKLGTNQNEAGIVELYSETNTLIGLMDKDGLKMFGSDGSYVLMNQQVGFSGYDANGNRIFWADKDEFHMKKSVVEEEITIAEKIRFIPIRVEENGVVVNDGIGIVSVAT